jgi:hypothetical protein
MVVSSDAPAVKAMQVPSFRLRVNDGSLQFAATKVITSFQSTARVPVNGFNEAYTLWIETPPEIDGNRMILSWDYLSANMSAHGYHPSQDDPRIWLYLERIEVEAVER